MNTRPVQRWFHTLVVTGASLTACGGTDEGRPTVVSAKDAATEATDGGSDAQSSDVVIIIPDVAVPQDAADDFRCCTITR